MDPCNSLNVECEYFHHIKISDCGNNNNIFSFSNQNLADDNGIPLFEVSAKDGTNVELAIAHTVARIWKTMKKQDILLLKVFRNSDRINRKTANGAF